MDPTTTFFLFFYVLIVAVIVLIVLCRSSGNDCTYQSNSNRVYRRPWYQRNSNYNNVHHVHHYDDTDINTDVQNEAGVASDMAVDFASAVSKMFTSGTNDYSGGYTDNAEQYDDYDNTDRNSDVQYESGVGSDTAVGFASAVSEMFTSGTSEDSPGYDCGGNDQEDTNYDDGGGNTCDDGGDDIIED